MSIWGNTTDKYHVAIKKYVNNICILLQGRKGDPGTPGFEGDQGAKGPQVSYCLYDTVIFSLK